MTKRGTRMYKLFDQADRLIGDCMSCTLFLIILAFIIASFVCFCTLLVRSFLDGLRAKELKDLGVERRTMDADKSTMIFVYPWLFEEFVIVATCLRYYVLHYQECYDALQTPGTTDDCLITLLYIVLAILIPFLFNYLLYLALSFVVFIVKKLFPIKIN